MSRKKSTDKPVVEHEAAVAAAKDRATKRKQQAKAPAKSGPAAVAAKPRKRLVIKRLSDGSKVYEGTRAKLSDALEFMAMRKRNMTGLDLKGANLHGLALPRETDISGSVLENAVLDQARIAGIWAQGASVGRLKARAADLRNIDLTGAEAYGVDFLRTRLTGSIWAGASLRESKFVSSDLAASIFADADLTFTKFSNLSLRNANLRGAKLHACEFDRVDARGADFTGAVFNEGQDLSGLDLRGAKGLDNVTIQTRHYQRIEGCHITGGKLVIPHHKHPDTIAAKRIDKMAAELKADLDQRFADLKTKVNKDMDALKDKLPKPRRPWPDMEP